MAPRVAVAAALVARQFASRTSSQSSTQVSRLIQRRGLAGAADHHGTPKVSCWKDPMNPGNWKEEHFVMVSLSGWGLLIYGGYKLATRGKGKNEEKVEEASHESSTCLLRVPDRTFAAQRN